MTTINEQIARLSENESRFDLFTNGAVNQDVLTRFGQTYPTLQKLISNIYGQTGYLVPVSYTAGISLTLPNQTVEYSGETYAPLLSELPFTTSGTFETAKFRIIQGVTRFDLAAPSGASLVGYMPAGVGVVATSLNQIVNAVFVSPLAYLSDAEKTAVLAHTSSADHTSAINAALATGKSLDLLGGFYNANNLTQTTSEQKIGSSRGIARIMKNANGTLVSSTGDKVEFQNISLYGSPTSTPTYTGMGFSATGNDVRFLNCGSRWSQSTALKSTGGHTQVIGTCDVYQTADTGSTAYDIDIGVSGTATLYHELIAIYTSQTTGGIRLTDTGSHTISGGQFGKLTITKGSGATPVGANGGKVQGARVIGVTAISDVSSATFTGNQFGGNVTFNSGTTGCSFDGSNILSAGKVVINLGIQNLVINGLNDGMFMLTGQIPTFENSIGFRFRRADGLAPAGATGTFTLTSANNLSLANLIADKQFQFIQSGAYGIFQFFANGNERLRIDANAMYPGGTVAGIYQGAGSPEGVVTAVVGGLYLRTDGGAGTTLYVKQSGTGNTGWIGK